MSQPIRKHYHALCKTILAPLGFKRSPDVHYRVTNDVLQYLHMVHYRGAHRFYLVFGAVPLCRSAPVEANCNLAFTGLELFEYSLGKHAISYNENDEGIAACVAILKTCFEHDLVPFFHNAVDCAQAFTENRRIYKTYASEEDYAIPWNEDEMYMLLKAGDYETALKYAKTIYESRLEGYEINKRSLSDPEHDAWMEQLLGETAELVLHVEANDVDWIQKHLQSNERRSRLSLGLET